VSRAEGIRGERAGSAPEGPPGEDSRELPGAAPQRRRAVGPSGQDQQELPGAARQRRRAVVILILACYLIAAVAVTSRLWADPASQTVAGNPNDASLFAWFLRYSATEV
jgi:hypothetical protein